MSNRATLLEGPIAKQLLALSWPVLVVLALQTFVGVAETYFVSFLGTDALAGVALVFPVFMLMTMMSNGGIGGGVSSAVARAIGAGRRHDAQALAMHAVVVGSVFGAIFTIGVWAGGPALFTLMGGQGDTLVGWGWVPKMGVAGAGLALICFNVGSVLVLALYMRSSRSPIRLAQARLEWRLFEDILKVGLLSAIGTVVANLTVVLTTGLVGAYGRDAIAGYGLASRLDYILIPLLFALGTASVTMVGTNVGAGQQARARKIAWTGALVSALATGAIGLAAALFPQAWIHLFSREAQVVELGSAYLARVAPLYAFFGVGMSLYFASQGAGKMAWPFAAGVVRLLVVFAAGGYWMNPLHGSLNGLYWIVAGSYLLFGAINLFAMASGLGWGHRTAHRESLEPAR